MKKSNQLLLSALAFAVLFILGSGVFYPKFAPQQVEKITDEYNEIRKEVLQNVKKELLEAK